MRIKAGEDPERWVGPAARKRGTERYISGFVNAAWSGREGDRRAWFSVAALWLGLLESQLNGSGSEQA